MLAPRLPGFLNQSNQINPPPAAAGKNHRSDIFPGIANQHWPLRAFTYPVEQGAEIFNLRFMHNAIKKMRLKIASPKQKSEPRLN